MFKLAALCALTTLVTAFALPNDPLHVYLLALAGWFFLTCILWQSARLEKRVAEDALQAIKQLEKFCQVLEKEKQAAENRTVEGESK